MITDENFEKEVNIANKFVLVDFFATWCGPCSVLGPILEKVAERFKEKLFLIKADVDKFPINAQRLGVDKVPTVILFKDGKPIDGFVGVMPEKNIENWLKNIVENK